MNSAHNRYAGAEEVVLDVEPRIAAGHSQQSRDRSATTTGGGGLRETRSTSVADLPKRNSGVY